MVLTWWGGEDWERWRGGGGCCRRVRGRFAACGEAEAECARVFTSSTGEGALEPGRRRVTTKVM